MLSKLKKIPAILRTEGLYGVYWRIAVRIGGDPYLKEYQKSYEKWYTIHGIETIQRDMLREDSKSWQHQPLISILTPIYNTNHEYLDECIKSVREQAYENWELILVDDNSSDPEIWPLLEGYAAADPRIKIKHRDANGHICVASNEALAMATGEWIALLDHDDVLWPNALYEVVKRINEKPATLFVYSDEDKIAENGRTHCDPFFKPDWSPHFLWSCNYITHFAVLKKSVVDAVEGFREKTQGAQDWDLFLRAIEHIQGYSQHPWDPSCQIQHIDTILYSWRKSETSTASEKHAFKAKAYAYNVQEKVLQLAIDAQGGGQVTLSKYIGIYEMRPALKSAPPVAILIPTKNNLEFLKPCLQSLEKTTYSNFKVYLVDTGSSEQVIAQYEGLSSIPITVLRWNKPFNYSEVCNYAVSETKEDYLVFLNDDTECYTPDWLERMLGFAQREEVGAVGCRLLYPNGSVQHNGLILGKEEGVVLGQQGFVSNYFRLTDPNKNYGLSTLLLDNIRDYSGVTAACMMVSRKNHERINGFDTRFKIAFNDVDYCLKLNQKYLYVIHHPQIVFAHHESVSLGRPEEGKRDLQLFADEIKLMRDIWGDALNHDQFSNKHLTLRSALLYTAQD